MPRAHVPRQATRAHLSTWPVSLRLRDLVKVRVRLFAALCSLFGVRSFAVSGSQTQPVTRGMSCVSLSFDRLFFTGFSAV